MGALLAAYQNNSYICGNIPEDEIMRAKIKFASYFLLSVMAYTLVFSVCYCLMKYGNITRLFDLKDFALSFIFNFIPTCLLAIINWVIVFKIRATKGTVAKIAFDVSLSSVTLIGINYAFVFIMNESVNIGGSVFNDAMVLLIIELIYFSQKYRYSVQRELLAQQENQKYKYEILKAQIDPHFLFNSLNILYSLISLDRQKSRDFVLYLSDIYRYVMLQENKTRIHVDEELQFLESYISILQIRYDDCFKVEINRQDENNDMAMIIPFTLQLLIENAIKHNEISSKHNLTLNIDITSSGIDVSNHITPRKAESVSRIGLRYLTQLYSLHDKKFYAEKRGDIFFAHVPYI